MDLLDLRIVEQIDVLAGTLQALGQVGAGLGQAVGLQLQHMAAVGLAERLQARQQLRLAEQEHMGASVAVAGRQRRQGVQRLVLQALGIVDQQVDFLAALIEARHLAKQAVDILAVTAQPLAEMLQQGQAAGGLAAAGSHADHALLVAAGHQRLAQQGLAAAQRTADHQHQRAVARQLVQLGQHRLALRREELEARHPRREGVVAELVVFNECLVGMQAGHGCLIQFAREAPASAGATDSLQA